MILSVLRRIFGVMSTWPRWLVMSLSISMIAALGVLDYVTGTELNIAVLFIVPIVPATWILGTRWTAPLALLAGGAMFVANYVAGVQYASPLIPLWNIGSRFVVFMVVSQVVAYLHRTAVYAESLAQTDALTGIGNVRFFREAAAREIARAQRYGHPFTVAFIDVDDFKRINDVFGHEAGDRTLRALGQALAANVRKSDLVARIGGDEFVVLLPMMPARHSEPFLGMLRERLRRQLEDAPAPLTCSIGVVTFETPPASVDEALKLADERRHVAKQAGKDTIRHSVVPRPPSRTVAAPALVGSRA
ncbi:MAG TPA: GGDEF domain-containing protein [Thermomicrobiales bacterium]|nr:GGDEF domain-containing protein [Thermomicrobiales bacterium]